MSKKLFNAEEIAAFRSSPYVESVSDRSLVFTPEFKEKCHTMYQQGKGNECPHICSVGERFNSCDIFTVYRYLNVIGWF